ncbi:MAG: PAS domain-containing protein [Verrucomicrobiota bacterium]
MKPSGVMNDATYDQMIADLSETMSASAPGIAAPKRRFILEKIRLRLDSEPARVVTDPEGFIISINPAFTELCGHSFLDLKGKKPGSMLQGPESCPKSVALLRRAIRRRESVSTELINYHKDRSPYRVRIDLRPLFAPNGKLTGFEAEERKVG